MGKVFSKVHPAVAVFVLIVLLWLIYGIYIGPNGMLHLLTAFTAEIEHQSFSELLALFTKVHPVSVAVVFPVFLTFAIVCLGSLDSLLVVFASLAGAMASLLYTSFSVLSILAAVLCITSFIAYYIEAYRRTYREHQLLNAAND